LEITTEHKTEWLFALLSQYLGGSGLNWMHSRVFSLSPEELAGKFSILFSLVPRQIPAAMPSLSANALAGAEKFYSGYVNAPLTLQQLCRLFLMLRLPTADNQKILNTIFETADMNKLVILYKGLYWLDNAGDFVMRAAEGIRTNMVDVFDAIACENPYPARYFGEQAWNQMVLKAIFMGRPLHRIHRLRDRKNQQLALILHDFIHERWSAGRTVTPELWQLMPGFVTQAIAEDLEKAARSHGPCERDAALKALNESGLDDTVIATTWEEIGMAFNNKKN
jgi:hypothetical protein